MDAETKQRVVAYWADEGVDEYVIHGKACIFDMCDFAVSACQLDLDIDDPELRRLAMAQAKDWGVGWCE